MDTLVDLPRIGSTIAIGICLAAGAIDAATQLTPNTANARWSARNGSSSRGKVLWFDQSDTVFLYDGTANAQVQVLDAVTSPGAIDDVVFHLGTGATAGQVIGGWRRGTDDGWVYVAGGIPVKVSGTNPFGTGAMNPEGVAIADGCVFMALQAPSGNTTLVKHVFQVNPSTGAATLLTGGIPLTTGSTIATDGAPRISTSDCAAAWVFDDGSGTLRLQLYSAGTLKDVDTGDANSLTSTLRGFQLSHGKLVYEKVVGGIRQIFLFDSGAPNPAPAALTTDTSGGNFSPRTDGRHVAWLRGNADGTQVQVVFWGGLQRSDSTNQPANLAFGEHPLQLQRGQLLWQDVNGALRYDDGSVPIAVDIAPSTSVATPWLADGFVHWLGQGPGLGTKRGGFQLTGTAPADAQQPLPPFLLAATPGDKQMGLFWDRIAGASSYNVYLAEQSGVTKDNYASLPGGRKVPVPGGASVATVMNLSNNRPYYFAVSAVAASAEGPSSREAAAAPMGSWVAATGLTGVSFQAVAADASNANVAYAAGGGNLYRTVNGGSSWSALSGGIAGANVRALAVDAQKIYAATPDGKLFRSPDGGASWSDVLAALGGQGIGEQNVSIALDPAHAGTIYAGDFKLSSFNAGPDSYVIKSTDGGNNWAHLPNPTTPLGAELRAYSLAVTSTGVVYAGGTGTPNLARSGDGGATWTDVHIPGVSVFVYALSPGPASTIYAGTLTQGIFKSDDGGNSWKAANAGLSAPPPSIRALLVDSALPGVVHAGSSAGYWSSIDAGGHWIAGNTGTLSSSSTVTSLAMTPAPQLIAGTSAGLHLLDRTISPPPPPPASADLSLTLSASPTAGTVGQDLTFTLTVSNAGPDGATGVVLTDPLPADLTFVSAHPAQGSCAGTSTVTCSLGTIASGASVALMLAVSPTAAGTSSNQGSVTSGVSDPNTSNNGATLSFTVNPAQSGGGGNPGGGSGSPGGGGGGCAAGSSDPGPLVLAACLALALRRRLRAQIAGSLSSPRPGRPVSSREVRCARASQERKSSIPTAIAGTNQSASRRPTPAAAMAGPGQKPDSPQPRPKITEPARRRRSTRRRGKAAKRAVRSGAARRRAMSWAGTSTARAPAITTASVGSKAPAKSRKPITFSGCTIPESARPTPNSAPQPSAPSQVLTAAPPAGGARRRR